MKYIPNEDENMAYFASTLDVEDELDLTDIAEEELVDSDYEYDLFIHTLDNIRRGVAGGILTEEEGIEAEAQALEELKARLSGTFNIGYDEDEYDEDAEYSGAYNLAEFSSGSDFGQALLELAAEEFGGDPVEGLTELSEEIGLSADEVVGLVQGIYAPDDELAHKIAGFFDTTAEDEDAYLGFLYLAGQAQEDILSEAGYEEDEYDYEEEDEDAEYSAYNSRIYDLEDRLANFEAATAIKDVLAEMEDEAEDGIAEGWLPPVAKRLLFGNFSREEDRLAMFSQGCEASGVSAEEQLYGMRYALDIFRKCGPMATFGAYVQEAITPEEVEYERAIDEQARLNFQLMKERG